MFTEILRIKPVLDRGNAAAMEQSLNRRFQRVARRFGAGLRAIMKGTIFGIGLSLITRMLNPLKEIEERIKALGNQGQSAEDLADKFGTDSGTILQLQAVGQAKGLTPDQVTEKMTQFAAAVETARKEFADPNSNVSDASQAVKNFLDSTDLGSAFREFLRGMRADEAVNRDRVERAVFGEAQTGAAKRFINADPDAVSRQLNIPGREALGTAAKQTGAFEATRQGQAAGHEFRAFTEQGAIISQKQDAMLAHLLASQQRETEKVTQDLKRFETLQSFEKGMNVIIDGIQKLQTLLQTGIAKLTEILTKIENFRLPGLSIFGTKKKENQ